MLSGPGLAATVLATASTTGTVTVDVAPEAGLSVLQIPGVAQTLTGFNGQGVVTDNYDPSDPTSFTEPRMIRLASDAVHDTSVPFANAFPIYLAAIGLVNTGSTAISADITVSFALSAAITTPAPESFAAASTVLDVLGGTVDNLTGEIVDLAFEESRTVAVDTTGAFGSFPASLTGIITFSVALAPGETGGVTVQLADVVGAAPTLIPLPASAWFLILGAGGLLALGRRRV